MEKEEINGEDMAIKSLKILEEIHLKRLRIN